MGNNPMVGATVAVAVSIEEAAKNGKFQEISGFSRPLCDLAQRSFLMSTS